VNKLKLNAKTIIKKAAQVGAVVSTMMAPAFVAMAQLPNNLGSTPGLRRDETSINQLITTVINWLLGIAFGIAVLFLVIGGFWYITSAGNEETAEKGRNTAINALIGIVIIILSYVAVQVVSRLVSSPGNITP
jgi:amino acid transporter